MKSHSLDLPASHAGPVRPGDSEPLRLLRQLFPPRLISRFRNFALRPTSYSERFRCACGRKLRESAEKTAFPDSAESERTPSVRPYPADGLRGRSKGRPSFSGPGLPHHRHQCAHRSWTVCAALFLSIAVIAFCVGWLL